MRFLEAKQVCPTTRSGVEDLRRRFPGVYEAWRIYSTVKNDRLDQVAAPALEAYLCSGADLDSIAERIGEHRDTIRVYAHLFFDVIGKQHQRMHMLNDVIGRSIHFGLTGREYDVLWKLFGFLKGPMFLDCFLAHDGEPVKMTSYTQMSRSPPWAIQGRHRRSRRRRCPHGPDRLQPRSDFRSVQRHVQTGASCRPGRVGVTYSPQHQQDDLLRLRVCRRGRPRRAPAEFTKNGIEYRASQLIARAIGHDVEAPADLAFPPEKAGPTTLVEP